MRLLWTAVLFFVNHPYKVDGKCVMYGKCNTVENGIQYCRDSKDARLLSDKTAQHTLKELCPLLYSESGSYTCCDVEQINALSASVQPIIDMFQSCPACLRNLLSIFCELTCSPNQDQFLKVLKTGTNNSITNLECLYSTKFATNTFNSCKDVGGGDSITYVCNFDKNCNPTKMLNFLGDNDLSPFVVKYLINDNRVDDLIPQPIVTYNCTDNINATVKSCSCSDCHDACLKLDFNTKTEKTIFGISLSVFIIIVIGASFVILFGSANIIYFAFFERTTYFNLLDQPILEDKASPYLGSRPWLAVKISDFTCPIFIKWGKLCYRRRYVVLLISLIFAVVLSCGLVRFQSVDDPVKLFLDPKSPVLSQKRYFDENFGPFYRIEQLIITSDKKSENYTSLLKKKVLKEISLIISHIKNINGKYGNSDVKLSDICYSPLSPFNDNCLIQNVLNYFQDDSHNLDRTGDKKNYIDHIKYCAGHPYSFKDKQLNLSCYGMSGVPVEPTVAFGGYTDDVLTSKALVVTFLVKNSLDPDFIKKAEAWEKGFISFLEKYKSVNFKLSFSAQISVDLETAKTQKKNIPSVSLAVFTMFIVFLLTSSFYTRPSHPIYLFIKCNFRLYITTVLVSVLSLTSSIGMLSFAGVSCSFMALMNLVFLVLGISFVNFLQLHHSLWWLTWPHATCPEEMLGDLVSSIFPGIFTSYFTQIVILYGAYCSSIPVVSMFGLFAGTTVLINFLLFSTFGVAFMAFETSKRMDSDISVSPLRNFMRVIFARVILKNYLRPMIIAAFFFWLLVSISSLINIPVGLDPASSFSTTSYMHSYLNNQRKYLKVGPPVYFVLPDGFNFDNKTFRSAISGSSTCYYRSLSSIVSAYAQYSSKSGISTSPKNWLDQYTKWRKSDKCCRYHKSTGEFCNSTVQSDDCLKCDKSLSFLHYVDWFLMDIPNSTCPDAGRAEYLSAINHTGSHIRATNYMSFHVPLNSSSLYMDVFKEAKNIANLVSKSISEFLHTKVNIFPYSYFYIFFAQYETILKSSFILISSLIVVIFVVVTVFSGLDFLISLIISVTISAALVTLLGTLTLFGVELNAVVVLNLLMAMCILVECVVNSTRSFVLNIDFSKVKRVTNMLEYSGSTIVAGFTFVWLIGSAVLAATTTQMMHIYYFKTFMMIAFVVSSYVLVFLPVFLVYVGPSPLFVIPDEIRYSI